VTRLAKKPASFLKINDINDHGLLILSYVPITMLDLINQFYNLMESNWITVIQITHTVAFS
jgi:hypothetical protein